MFNLNGHGWGGGNTKKSAARRTRPNQAVVGNPDPTGSDDLEFSNNVKAQSETFNDLVFLDPDLMMERMAAKNLAMRTGARFVYTAGGGVNENWDVTNNWFDTQLGINAKPSGDGETAIIPKGKRCNFNVANGSCPNLKWLRVDGELDTDLTADRTYTFEYLFIDHTGEFYIGKEGSPVPMGRKIRYTPYNCNTDMDYMNDMMMLGRGILCFDGISHVHGHDKTAWSRLSAGVASGTSVLPALNGAVTDWEVGDRLRITGTRMGGRMIDGWEDFESEYAEIQSIGGTTNAPIITLVNPLANDHFACHADATLTAHVLNLTRSVEFTTPSGQTPEIWQRPHILRKGNGGIVWKNYSIEGYGRTNHDESVANDGVNYPRGTTQHTREPWNGPTFVNGSFGEVDYTSSTGTLKDGTTVVSSSGGTATMISGYNGYIYMSNIDVTGGGFEDGDTLTFSNGSTATAGPNYLKYTVQAQTNYDGRYPDHLHRCGWEDPNSPAVILTGGVVIDSPAWAHVHHDSHANITWNISVDHRSAGFAAEGGGSIGTWAFCVADTSKESTFRYTETTTKNGGLSRGAAGHGAWMNSRLVHVQNCVFCNNQNQVLWTSRVASAQHTGPYPGATAKPENFFGLADVPGTTVSKAFAPIEGFLDNEFYAGPFGMAVAKKMPNQHHWDRSFLDTATIWEVDLGAAFQYTAGYTLKNFRIIGFNPAYRNGNAPYNASRGVSVFRQAVDFAVVDATIEEFPNGNGIVYTQNGGTNFLTNLGHVTSSTNSYINVATPILVSGVGSIDLDQGPFDSQSDGLLDVTKITPTAAAPITINYHEDQCYWEGDFYCMFGNYTDRLGTHEFVLGTRNDLTPLLLQSERPSTKATKTSGYVVLLDKVQIGAQIANEGVWDASNGDKMSFVRASIRDRYDGTYTDDILIPFVIRISNNDYGQLSKTEHGSIIGQFGGAYDTFAPAGTPGLTG